MGKFVNFLGEFCEFLGRFGVLGRGVSFCEFLEHNKAKNSQISVNFPAKFTLFSALILALILPLNAQTEQYLQTQRMQLEAQTREFNEARAALQTYRESFLALQRQKMDELIKKEADINATLARIEATKAENERILQQNESRLKSIEDKSESRIKGIYSQMKDSAIAGVLNEMSAEDASKIIVVLEARKVSSVLAKMEPAKASAITLILQDTKDDSNTTQSPTAPQPQ